MTKKSEPDKVPDAPPLTETAPEPAKGGVYVDGKRVEGPEE